MLDFEFRSHCPISSALDIFGDKWSLVIIRDLFIGINTYSDFLKSPEKISTNILVDRIKKLRSHGILDFKRDVNDNKIKYYYLTDSGIDLFPMIMNLSLWSRKHLHVEPGPFSKRDYALIDLNGLDSFLKETTSKYTKTRETILN
jgi:DNA-binding HxlR family transcriptional regulator